MELLKLKSITDKDLIVFLTATGQEIKNIHRDKNGKKSIVYFEDNEELNDAIIRYANKKDLVNLCDFIAAEKRIKTLLYVQKN